MSFRGAVWIVATVMCLAFWYAVYVGISNVTWLGFLDFIYALFLLAIAGAAIAALLVLKVFR